MDRLDYWRLCTDFTVVQAALIVCGIPPEDMQDRIERHTDSDCPKGYVAIRTAFRNALNSGRMEPSNKAYVVNFNGETTAYFDIESTTVSVEEIDRFLKSVGVFCEFFDRPAHAAKTASSAQSAMPAKLNAALRAWAAVVNDPVRLRGKSPKQALELWLTENAGELGLINREGAVNRTGIEEICKVANWKPEGGATPTPTAAQIATTAPTSRPMIRLPHLREDFSASLDDEIPF